MMSDIEIEYWFEGEIMEHRTRSFVPRQGDFIEFKLGLYKVISICWCENEVPGQSERVQIVIFSE